MKLKEIMEKMSPDFKLSTHSFKDNNLPDISTKMEGGAHKLIGEGELKQITFREKDGWYKPVSVYLNMAAGFDTVKEKFVEGKVLLKSKEATSLEIYTYNNPFSITIRNLADYVDQIRRVDKEVFNEFNKFVKKYSWTQRSVGEIVNCEF